MNTPDHERKAEAENEISPEGKKSPFVLRDDAADREAELAQRVNDDAKIANIRASILKPMSISNERPKTFADTLEPTNFDVGNVKIWKLKDDTSVFVRENIPHNEETLDSIEASARDGERLFGKISREYGIRVVGMHIKREKNVEGNDAVFTFVDAIDGENLAKKQSLPQEAKGELEDMYASLARYYGDSWRNDLPYWGDCRSDQFVYGKKFGETRDHLYIVDVDSKFFRKGEDRFSTIDAALGSLCGELIENERKFDPPVRLEKGRRELLRVINEILEKEPDLHMIAEARDWLLS